MPLRNYSLMSDNSTPLSVSGTQPIPSTMTHIQVTYKQYVRKYCSAIAENINSTMVGTSKRSHLLLCYVPCGCKMLCIHFQINLTMHRALMLGVTFSSPSACLAVVKQSICTTSHHSCRSYCLTTHRHTMDQLLYLHH